MAWTFARSHVRIAVSAVALLLAPFIGTADAQVSVPGNYATIQAAINAVLSGGLPDGTTIDVQPGTYFEVLSVANTGRSMTVRGVGGPGATVVDAGGRNAPVLNVLRATGQVVFRGLTFRNAATAIEGGGFLIRESSPSLVDASSNRIRHTVVAGGRFLPRTRRLRAASSATTPPATSAAVSTSFRARAPCSPTRIFSATFPGQAAPVSGITALEAGFFPMIHRRRSAARASTPMVRNSPPEGSFIKVCLVRRTVVLCSS